MELLTDVKLVLFLPKIPIQIVLDNSTVSSDDIFIVSPNQELPNDALILVSLENYIEIIRQPLRYLFMISLHGENNNQVWVLKWKSAKKVIIFIEEGSKAASYDQLLSHYWR